MFYGTIHFKWLDSIRETFNSTGYTYILNNQFSTNQTNISILIKRSLIDQFIQNWNVSMSNSNKGSNYKAFKNEFKLEKYLTALPNNQAMLIFKLRTYNTKFPVEIGRWNNTPYHERYCNQCDSRDLGDIFHYLFKCHKYNDMRNKYISRYYRVNPNMIKFIELFQTENTVTLKHLSIFTNLILRNFTNP